MQPLWGLRFRGGSCSLLILVAGTRFFNTAYAEDGLLSCWCAPLLRQAPGQAGVLRRLPPANLWNFCLGLYFGDSALAP